MPYENASERIKKRYQGEAGEKYRQKHRVPKIAHPWIARYRSKQLKPHIRTGDVVLEYGVGPGWNLEAIPCKKRIGYDLSNDLHDQLIEKGVEFTTNLQTISDRSIDVVICRHVLEHTIDPAQALTDIHRLLRKNGRLILIVPFEKEKKYRHFQLGEKNHHLYSWNVQTLGNLVSDLGFAIQKSGIGRYGYDRFLAVLASKAKIGECGFNLLKKLSLAIIPLLEVRIIAEKSSE